MPQVEKCCTEKNILEKVAHIKIHAKMKTKTTREENAT